LTSEFETIKEDEMKKLLVVLMVLSMATIANAGLTISVNGVDNPQGTIEMQPSQEATIDIQGDGQTPSPLAIMLISEGLGSMSGGGIVMANNSASSEYYYPQPGGMPDYLTALANAGYSATSAIYINAVSTVIPYPNYSGKIVDNVLFHCDGIPGNATLSLLAVGGHEDEDTGDWVWEFTSMDTQVITQVPEPITMALLGLGGLFLRRRK
jgi:hypothetical protein